MEEIFEKNESHKVIGHIYKIINLIDNKHYIGQTRSHRLNRNKYRPFGYTGRFRDHISEAMCSNKEKQCRYLNNAIIKHGVSNFRCELIMTCSIDELDENEVYYIIQYNSKYPNGYNLTDGGQKKGFKKGTKITLHHEESIKHKSNIRVGLKRSEHTKELISCRLKEYKNNPENLKKSMLITQKQHVDKRFNLFKNFKINRDDIDQYISIIKNNTQNYEYVRVTINKVRTNFVGKFESIESIKERARQFIFDLLEWQDNLVAGTPLEPLLPLDNGNLVEELG